ncbi:ABC-type Fe3+-hydroxamate transport system, periplasmic component [Thermus oshimai JL-2]|uniref:ABC-type Fe3+-hydroxamate transport system, periplasmic component n=1 Tax=Thermus oshimai JL-2 TaxID=751945 RepID=K7QZS6_THEOS|nr:helical backbone metal receptor [Thermus oshimai]AFV76460.1 ABC-type Fe3+-hydroxamate transport system, periplasmic component [Thermus oshimai JL-2]
MRVFHEILGPLDLPDRFERIVSLAPNVTDALFALGVGERVVGRSAFCHRPAEVLSLPVLASYTKTRTELLRSLRPDLVLLSTGVQREQALRLKEEGFPVYALPLPTSPYGILENLSTLGHLLDLEERATELAHTLAQRYARLRGRFQATVYFEMDLGGAITVGRGSYIAQALLHLGLRPLFLDVPQAYFTPDLEEVRRRRPDLFLYEPKPWGKNPLERARALAQERGWDFPVAATDGDELAHYGPLFFAFLEKVAERVAETLGQA